MGTTKSKGMLLCHTKDTALLKVYRAAPPAAALKKDVLLCQSSPMRMAMPLFLILFANNDPLPDTCLNLF